MSENPKIRLRAVEPEDLDILYTIENDTSLWGVGATSVPYSRYVLRDYIAHATADIYQDRQVRLMVENGESEVIGIADVVNFDPQHQRAELGLVIMAPYRRRGYARATAVEVMDYALSVLHLHQLYVIIAEDNRSTRELFVKLGFTESSRLVDWLFDGRQYRDAFILQRIL